MSSNLRQTQLEFCRSHTRYLILKSGTVAQYLPEILNMMATIQTTELILLRSEDFQYRDFDLEL